MLRNSYEGMWITISRCDGIGSPSLIAGMYLNWRIAESGFSSIVGVTIPAMVCTCRGSPSASIVTSTVT